MLNPLRYPGGKADFLDTFEEIITVSGHFGLPIVEPYAGSAAISLGLLERRAVKTATLIERDPLLYSFWTCVFERTELLIDRFHELPITIETRKKLQPMLSIDSPNRSNLMDLAVACLFFNRTNFSGILNGGPIGGMSQESAYPIDCRTNKSDLLSRIAQIAEWHGFVEVKFGDGLKEIKDERRRSRVIYYVDPPYVVMGEKLYRYHFLHRDHKALAAELNKARFPWVLSYDNDHVIEYLYEDFHVRSHSFLYSAKSSKQHSELVIANFDLPQTLFRQTPKRKRSRRIQDQNCGQ